MEQIDDLKARKWKQIQIGKLKAQRGFNKKWSEDWKKRDLKDHGEKAKETDKREPWQKIQNSLIVRVFFFKKSRERTRNRTTWQTNNKKINNNALYKVLCQQKRFDSSQK